MKICRLGFVLLLLGVGIITSGNAFAMTDEEIIKTAESYLATPASREQQETDMREYVKFRSVAAGASYTAESRAAADWLRNWLETRLDMKDAALYESGFRNPVVVASSSPGSDKPGVIIYGHYDVQPADGEWHISGPFELKKIFLENYGEVFTGRGSSDCKGQQYLALSALEALNQSIDGGLASLPINIMICIEGEEEIGSPGFPHFLKSHGEQLFSKAKLVLSSDGSNPQDHGKMQLSTRGLFGVQIDVMGAKSDLHSGTYGGSFLNPLVALSRVVGTLHDPSTNKIAIDTFYDDVEDFTKEEIDELGVVDDEAEAKRLGVTAMVGEEGYSTMERKTIRPTLELTGIYGGFQGEGIKTVLPSEAHAKIVFRLVPGQDPDRVFSILVKHVEKVSASLAKGLKVSVQRLNPGAKAYKADRNSVGFNLVKQEITKVFGSEPKLERSGGSVNAFADFHEILNLESFSFGFGDNDGYIHAPDERFRLASLHQGQSGYISMILSAAKVFGDSDHTEL